MSRIGLSIALCASLGAVSCFVVQHMGPHVFTPTMLVRIEQPPLDVTKQGVPPAKILDSVSGNLIGYTEGMAYPLGPANVKIEPWKELQGEAVPRRIVDAATNKLIGLTLPAQPLGGINPSPTARTPEPRVVRFESCSMGRYPFRIVNVVTRQEIGYTDQAYSHMLEPTVAKLEPPERQGSDRFAIVDVATGSVVGHTSKP